MNDKRSISNTVKSFYNKYPFPGFDINKYISRDDLLKQATEYAKMIYMNIPYGKKIIDIGCGTGQFTCLLSLKASYVVGVDFSEASIKRANELKQRLGLKNIEFLVGNIENLNIPQGKFNYVFCNGVLHHLKDQYKGFLNICRFLDEGSYIIMGSYNKYGRIVFNMRKMLSKIISKNRNRPKIEEIKSKGITGGVDAEKKSSWFLDQYFHPYEKTFTVSEIINWFNKNNISYISSMPSIESIDSSRLFTRPFVEQAQRGSLLISLKYFFVQLSWIWSLRNSGGYFVLIGRR